MNRLVAALSGSLLLGAAGLVTAAPVLKSSGSVRARYEALSGQSRPGFKSSDELASLRTILSAELDTGVFRVGAELTDSRAWLADVDSAVSSNDVNALEPSQLYVAADVDAAFGPGTTASAQAGRFAMNIGSRRLVSNDDYRNTGSSVGGLRTDAKLRGGWSTSAWYVLPDLRLPDDIDSIRSNDVQLDRESRHAVLWGTIVTSPRKVMGGAVDALYTKFRESDAPGRPTRDRNLDSWSLRWYRDPAAGRFDFEVEAIRQTGRARTGTSLAAPLRDVAADFEHVRFGYQWDVAWKPRLAVEFDRATGDRGSDKVRRFDTLIGGRRFDLAPSGLYNQVGRANLNALGLRLELNPSGRLDLMGTWKLLRLESRTDSFSTTGVRDASGRSGDFAGHQFDLRARYWLVPNRWRAEIDTLVLLKGRFLERAPNARPGDTRFVSLNLTRSF